jgi:hypothetical protein
MDSLSDEIESILFIAREVMGEWFCPLIGSERRRDVVAAVGASRLPPAPRERRGSMFIYTLHEQKR